MNPVDRSLQKLADELGLPLKSVIRALEGQWGVSDETRDRVRAAAAAHGYSPNLTIQSFAVSESSVQSVPAEAQGVEAHAIDPDPVELLALPEPALSLAPPEPDAPDVATIALRKVCLLMADFANPDTTTLFGALERELGKHGFNLIAASPHPDPAHTGKQLTQLVTQSLAGFLIFATPFTDVNTSILPLAATGIPTVVVVSGSHVSVDADRAAADFVVCDIAETVAAAGQYLLAAGRQRVLLLLAGDGATESRIVDRWSDIHRASGIELDSSLIRLDVKNANDAEEAVLGLLRSTPGAIDAVATVSDELASGVLRGCRRVRRIVGRRHTDEIEVVCAADSPACQLLDPAVTAFALPFQAIARQSVARLIAHIEEPADWSPERVALHAKLVARGSA